MIQRIPLTRGQEALIDDEDAERVLAHKWHAKPATQRDRKYYAVATVGERTTYLHRFILGAGRGQLIDHINNDPLDNRRENLRFADCRINNVNRHYQSRSGYRGVHPYKAGKWRAQIARDRKHYKGPSRATPEEAARDYDKLARELFGEYARLNFGGEQ